MVIISIEKQFGYKKDQEIFWPMRCRDAVGVQVEDGWGSVPRDVNFLLHNLFMPCWVLQDCWRTVWHKHLLRNRSRGRCQPETAADYEQPCQVPTVPSCPSSFFSTSERTLKRVGAGDQPTRTRDLAAGCTTWTLWHSSQNNFLFRDAALLQHTCKWETEAAANFIVGGREQNWRIWITHSVISGRRLILMMPLNADN